MIFNIGIERKESQPLSVLAFLPSTILFDSIFLLSLICSHFRHLRGCDSLWVGRPVHWYSADYLVTCSTRWFSTPT